MYLQTFIVPFGNRHITFQFMVDEVLWISPYVIEELFFWIPGTLEHQWEKHFNSFKYRPFYFSQKEDHRRMVTEDVFSIILFSLPVPREIAIWYNEYVKKILKLSSIVHKTPRRLQQTVKTILTTLSELQLFNKKYFDIFSKHLPNIFQFEATDQHAQYELTMSKMYLQQQIRLLNLLKLANVTTESVLSTLIRCADTSSEMVAQLGPTRFPYADALNNDEIPCIDLVCHEDMPASPIEPEIRPSGSELTDHPTSPDIQENVTSTPLEIPTTSATEVVYEHTMPLDLRKKAHDYSLKRKAEMEASMNKMARREMPGQEEIPKETYDPVYESLPTPLYSMGQFPRRLIETPEPPRLSSLLPFPNKLRDLKKRELDVPVNEDTFLKTLIKKCPYIIVKIFQLDNEGKVLKFTHCKRVSVNTSLKRLRRSMPQAIEVFTGRMLPSDGDILRIVYNQMINYGIPCRASRNTFTFDTVEDATFMLALCKTMFETKKFK